MDETSSKGKSKLRLALAHDESRCDLLLDAYDVLLAYGLNTGVDAGVVVGVVHAWATEPDVDSHSREISLLGVFLYGFRTLGFEGVVRHPFG